MFKLSMCCGLRRNLPTPLLLDQELVVAIVGGVQPLVEFPLQRRTLSVPCKYLRPRSLAVQQTVWSDCGICVVAWCTEALWAILDLSLHCNLTMSILSQVAKIAVSEYVSSLPFLSKPMKAVLTRTSRFGISALVESTTLLPTTSPLPP